MTSSNEIRIQTTFISEQHPTTSWGRSFDIITVDDINEFTEDTLNWISNMLPTHLKGIHVIEITKYGCYDLVIKEELTNKDWSKSKHDNYRYQLTKILLDYFF